jgi:hypothetical protein
MADPLVPRRLSDAIVIVGTCPDMCPRHERYRRERELRLDRLECVRFSRYSVSPHVVKRSRRRYPAPDKSIIVEP